MYIQGPDLLVANESLIFLCLSPVLQPEKGNGKTILWVSKATEEHMQILAIAVCRFWSCLTINLPITWVISCNAESLPCLAPLPRALLQWKQVKKKLNNFPRHNQSIPIRSSVCLPVDNNSMSFRAVVWGSHVGIRHSSMHPGNSPGSW